MVASPDNAKKQEMWIIDLQRAFQFRQTVTTTAKEQ